MTQPRPWLRALGECDSTNDEAAAWARDAESPAPHGAVVLADSQRKGRGRMGRSWVSPPGGNLYASFVLRPSRPADRLAGITLAAAVAFAEALEDLGAAVRIKWPNDLLLGGRKLGGILTELHVPPKPKDPADPCVIVGLGLNLATAPPDLPPTAHPAPALPATSLAELPGGPPAPAALAESLRTHLPAAASRFDAGGFPALRADWESRWRDLGRRIAVTRPGDAPIEGVATGVDDDGALLLGTGGAAHERITAGDVAYTEAS